MKNSIFGRYCMLIVMSFSVSFSDDISESTTAGHGVTVRMPYFQIGGVFFGTPPGEDGWWRSLSCSAILEIATW